MPSLSYQIAGRGPHVVVALHGWFGDHSTFDALLESVDLDRYTWICPAYRGYGISRALEGEYTLDEIGADVVALADALGLDRFSLVGHSMGGKAIQRVLALAPQRVRRLVGVAPVPASGLPLDPDARRLFSEAVHSSEARTAIVTHSTGHRLTPRYVDRIVRHSLRTARAEAFAGYLASFADADFHELVEGSQAPVKVILGDSDPEMNEGLMRGTWLAWYPNCELETIPGAGHYPTDETPIALATSIESFLDED